MNHKSMIDEISGLRHFCGVVFGVPVLACGTT
jgi:hypothetical protein